MKYGLLILLIFLTGCTGINWQEDVFYGPAIKRPLDGKKVYFSSQLPTGHSTVYRDGMRVGSMYKH